MRRIKKGDQVIVVAGSDKGKTGEVSKVFPKDDKLIVSGVRVVTKHQKANRQEQGKIVKFEKPIHCSNVALLDPADNKSVKVGFKFENNKKVRYSKRSGSVL